MTLIDQVKKAKTERHHENEGGMFDKKLNYDKPKVYPGKIYDADNDKDIIVKEPEKPKKSEHADEIYDADNEKYLKKTPRLTVCQRRPAATMPHRHRRPTPTT